MNNKTRVQYLLLRKTLQQQYGVPTNVMNQKIWFIPPECKGQVLEWDKWKELERHEFAIVWYDWWILKGGPLIRDEYGYPFYCEYCLSKSWIDKMGKHCIKCGLKSTLTLPNDIKMRIFLEILSGYSVIERSCLDMTKIVARFERGNGDHFKNE